MSEPRDLPPLDEESAALLRDLEEVSPPAGAIERVQSRVHSTLQLPPGDGGAAGNGTSSSQPSGPASAGNSVDAANFAAPSVVTKAVVVAFALGATLGTGGTYVAMRASNEAPTSFVTEAPAPRPQAVDVRVDPPPPTPPIAAPEPEPALLSPAPSTDATSPPTTKAAVETPRRSRPARTTETPTGSARDRALGDENSLITRAQSALARGQAALALEALDEHRRRFRAGQFAQERDAMTIQALAKLGRMDEARRAATVFRAQYPGSMLRRAVDAVAGDAP